MIYKFADLNLTTRMVGKNRHLGFIAIMFFLEVLILLILISYRCKSNTRIIENETFIAVYADTLREINYLFIDVMSLSKPVFYATIVTKPKNDNIENNNNYIKIYPGMIFTAKLFTKDSVYAEPTNRLRSGGDIYYSHKNYIFWLQEKKNIMYRDSFEYSTEHYFNLMKNYYFTDKVYFTNDIIDYYIKKECVIDFAPSDIFFH